MLGVLYFACFLDRGKCVAMSRVCRIIFANKYFIPTSIGNAKVAGMADDLGLIGNQYGAAVSVVVSNLMLRACTG